jgi:GR25 family glycosyltransferase involved in LPS biosynthesis
MLSHLNIWKHIIESDVPIANVFEDDIMFHPEWNTLQQTFYDETPKDFHILYLGSKHYSENTNHIQTSPVYCTHAYTITNNGARVLYNMLVNDPRGVSTIDGHIRKYMNYIQAMLPNEKIRPLMWYAWNATGHPCMEADMPADFKWRNAGLVFQDYVWPSFIQESYT